MRRLPLLLSLCLSGCWLTGAELQERIDAGEDTAADEEEEEDDEGVRRSAAAPTADTGYSAQGSSTQGSTEQGSTEQGSTEQVRRQTGPSDADHAEMQAEPSVLGRVDRPAPIDHIE